MGQDRELDFLPVIIIGAARSGTNVLRDVLCRIPGCGTWPCDEINYVWRHGNTTFPSDEFTPNLATPRVRQYIRGEFSKLARKQRLRFVVEKTCANSLRVGFIDRVVPEAQYVFLTRDGVDCVASVMKRWTASLDISYLFRKARYVPKTDLPFYATRYLANRMYKLTSGERRLASWGPALNDMPSIVAQHSLDQVCAIQWRSSVDRAREALGALPEHRVHKIRYEEFVASPGEHLEAMCNFLGAELPADGVEEIVSDVSPNSVGKGRSQLDAATIERIEPYLMGEA